MKNGSWPSILGIYLFGICAGASVGKLIPLAGDMAATFRLTGSAFGWLVALVALPAALLAMPGGVLVDSWGSKRTLAVATLVGIVANLGYLVLGSHSLLYLARLGEGLAMVLVYTAAPAYLMSTVSGDRRTKAMTLWSTYTPVGTALGLALAGYLASAASWRLVFAAHAAFYALAGLLLLLQEYATPLSAPAKPLRERLEDLVSAFGRPELLSLGMAFFLIVGVGLGVNITLPLFIERVHSMSASGASSLVASVTLVMVAGSAVAAVVLGRGMRTSRVFAGLGLAAIIAGSLSFAPALALPARYAAMAAWFLFSGAALATILAALPVAADPRRPGAAAAMLAFTGAVATFVAPPLWLGVEEGGQWLPFAALLSGGWLAAGLSMGLMGRFARRRRDRGLGARG